MKWGKKKKKKKKRRQSIVGLLTKASELLSLGSALSLIGKKKKKRESIFLNQTISIEYGILFLVGNLLFFVL